MVNVPTTLVALIFLATIVGCENAHPGSASHGIDYEQQYTSAEPASAAHQTTVTIKGIRRSPAGLYIDTLIHVPESLAQGERAQAIAETIATRCEDLPARTLAVVSTPWTTVHLASPNSSFPEPSVPHPSSQQPGAFWTTLRFAVQNPPPRDATIQVRIIPEHLPPACGPYATRDFDGTLK